MPYTPRRQFVVDDPTPAKPAKAAKVWPDPTAEPATLATLATLAGCDPCNNNSADVLAERAAIVQEGAGVPAEWADGFARLEALPVPRGVSQAAWLAMMDAAGRFLDQWGSQAAALGWTAGELFGLDATSPLYRWDRRGAGFYLVDCEVIEVSALAIKVKKPGGLVQHVYRRAGFTVPAWEHPEFLESLTRAPNLVAAGDRHHNGEN